MKNNLGKNLVMAIVISAILSAVFVAGFLFVGHPVARRMFEMLGGNMPFGIIQFLSYVAFLTGMFEIGSKIRHTEEERKGLKMGLLPEQEQWVMTPDDVNSLKVKMIDLEKSHRFQVINVIKKACTKYRSSQSVGEVMNLVSSQINLFLKESESRQSTIRYLGWLIPSLGFIGTVLGIAQSLGLAEKASDPEVMGAITNAMEVAFDTTFIALVLSIPLLWYHHRLQEKEELLYVDMENYVMENLVNRIHHT